MPLCIHYNAASQPHEIADRLVSESLSRHVQSQEPRLLLERSEVQQRGIRDRATFEVQMSERLEGGQVLHSGIGDGVLLQVQRMERCNRREVHQAIIGNSRLTHVELP